MIRVAVKIMPRDVILDIQGRAVEESLMAQGFNIQSCRIGKVIECNINVDTKDLANSEIEKMLKDGGLYNPLTEKYEILTN